MFKSIPGKDLGFTECFSGQINRSRRDVSENSRLENRKGMNDETLDKSSYDLMKLDFMLRA